jgi:molybdenum cofactor synthesis domain-containing protein
VRAAIITSSDKGYAGEREDKSGSVIHEMLTGAGYEVVDMVVLPDEKGMLAEKMLEYCNEGIELVLTTGGTGFSVRDVTPEATRMVIEREVPGIPQAMLYNSLQITPRAMLTRAIAGIRNRTLIINLPGSPKAVREDLEYILPSLEHGLEILQGTASECARTDKS